MIKRVETNLYKSEAIRYDIENATDLATGAGATANTALSRASAEYGLCDDIATEQNKEADVIGFTELYVGATCTVTFVHRNEATNPTLNVNGTGAKPIYARGSGLSATSGYNWENGATVQFVYDGNYWVMMPNNMQEAVNVIAGTNANSNTQIMYVQNGQVYINADHIASGTIDASVVNVTKLNAANITVGSITGSQIATSTITADNIASNAITSAKILAGAITANKIEAGAITADKIYAGAVTADKIGAGAITADKIGPNAVTSEKIASNNVTLDKMAGSITQDDWKIDFTTGTLTIGSISANKITTGTLDGQNVNVTNLNASSITAGTLSVNRIPNLNASKIIAGTLSADRIGANSISVSKLTGTIKDSGNTWQINLTDGTMTVGDISANSIKTGTLNGNNITVTNLNASSITAGTLSADRIPNLNASKITAGTLNANRIGANTISVSKLTGSITDSGNTWNIDLTNGTLTLGNISADKITAGTLSASRISGGNLKLGGVSGSTGNAGILEVYDDNSTRVARWDDTGAYFGNIASNLTNANLTISTGGVLQSVGKPQTGYTQSTTIDNGSIEVLYKANAAISFIQNTTLKSGTITLSNAVGTASQEATLRSERLTLRSDLIDGRSWRTDYDYDRITFYNDDSLIRYNGGGEYAYTNTKEYCHAQANETLRFYEGPFVGRIADDKKSFQIYIPSAKSLKGRTFSSVNFQSLLTVETAKGPILSREGLIIPTVNPRDFTWTGEVYEHGICLTGSSTTAFTNADGSVPCIMTTIRALGSPTYIDITVS